MVAIAEAHDCGDYPYMDQDRVKPILVHDREVPTLCKWNGWTVIQAEDCWHKSLKPLMAKVRAKIGDAPCYLSYDIDSLDPAFAPGTGTVEPGGLTIWQGLEIVRGAAGLNLVGGDLVEVSPPYDPSGNTALIGANLLYEMLCVLPGVPQGTRR